MPNKLFKSIFFWVTSLLFSRQTIDAQSLPFEKFLGKVIVAPDSLAKSRLINDYLSNRTLPILERNTAYFLYRGNGSDIQMPAEFNGWDPRKTKMVRIPQTNLFLHIEDIPRGGRFEYKFYVDGNWILDPLNPKKAPGGLGENSEVWSPTYSPPTEIELLPRIPCGRLDSLRVDGKAVRRNHHIFVYVPFGTDGSRRLPTIYVTDGGEYLSLGQMKNVLDNLIDQKRIQPVIAVFIDPRVDIRDNSTNQRLTDYAANDKYLDFLEHELSSLIEHTYPAARSAKDRLIMGASMGGLISTYAVMLRSHFVKNCAAQSPAYKQADKAVMKLFDQVIRLDANVYMDSGTIADTQEEARLVSGLLKEKGAKVHYTEYPEGHNWSNWRARLDDLLEYFFPLN